MARTFAKGRYALSISDRSGQAFPYLEMVKEWNGALVHISEYEPKSPQLDPPHHIADPEALYQPRPTISAPTTGQGYAIVSNPKDSNGVSSPIMWAQNSDTIGSMYNMSALTGSVGELTVSV